MSNEGSHSNNSLGRDIAHVVLAYVVALGVAWAVLRMTSDRHPLMAIGLADAAATVVVFAFSVMHNNSSMYDPYWSVAPIPIALYLHLNYTQPNVPSLRVILVIGLVCAWGLRLTYNWLRGWTGMGHEDWRYVRFRQTTGRAYWLVSFLGIHFFPTVMVFLGCFSLWPALATGTQPFGLLDVVALLWTVMAITIETVADNQLRAFVTRERKPGEIMQSGLWSWSRHPNYFGEVSFWWGLFLFAMAADPSQWRLTIIGPLVMTALFVFISIPLLDKRSLERRPGYAEHMKRVSALIPLPPRRR